MGAVGGDGGLRRVHPGRFAAALRAMLPSPRRPIFAHAPSWIVRFINVNRICDAFHWCEEGESASQGPSPRSRCDVAFRACEHGPVISDSHSCHLIFLIGGS